MPKSTGVMLLLALSALAYGLQRTTSKSASNSPFNEQRAGADLQTIVGFGPRPAGSDAIVKTRNYIVSELEKAGLKVRKIFKLAEGRPNAVDLLKNREIQLVINTPAGQTPRADEVKIRTTAVYTNTPIMTTLSGARAAALGIAALRKSGYEVRTVQEYH